MNSRLLQVYRLKYYLLIPQVLKTTLGKCLIHRAITSFTTFAAAGVTGRSDLSVSPGDCHSFHLTSLLDLLPTAVHSHSFDHLPPISLVNFLPSHNYLLSLLTFTPLFDFTHFITMDPNTNLHPVNFEGSPTESEGTLVEFEDALTGLEDDRIESPQSNLITLQSNVKTVQSNLKMPQLNLQTPQLNLQTPKLNFQTPQSKSRVGIPGDVEDYYCGKCSLWLNDFKALEHHVRTSLVHKPFTGNPSFMCAICRGRFPTGEILNAHIENPPWNSVMHASWEEANYAAECHPCNRLFMNQKSLNQHLESSTAHKASPRANCDACGFSFCDETALAQHLKSSQAHRKRYNCDSCGFEFGDETALAQHLRDSKAHRKAPNPNSA